MDRDYVRKDKGRFVPTKLGIAVTGLLTAHFPDVIDVGFTARVEEELDDIAAGERAWVPVLQEFYGPFNEAVTKAIENAERVPRSALDEETDIVCEKCERPMVIKSGRFGRFLSCSGFPECRNSRPLVAQVGVPCPECGGDLVERRGGKSKRTFYGCSNYPKCDFTVSRKPLPAYLSRVLQAADHVRPQPRPMHLVRLPRPGPGGGSGGGIGLAPPAIRRRSLPSRQCPGLKSWLRGGPPEISGGGAVGEQVLTNRLQGIDNSCKQGAGGSACPSSGNSGDGPPLPPWLSLVWPQSLPLPNVTVFGTSR